MHSFISEISSILRLLRAETEHGMANRNLGFPEQMVLMCLYPDKTCNQDAIAHMLGVDKGAIARTLTKLDEKGLIIRTPNPQNRRENLVSIAPASIEILGEMRENVRLLSERAFEGFSQDERQMVISSLARIAANLRGEEDGESEA